MNDSLKFFIIILHLLIPFSLKGQMESFPCRNSNPELKILFNGDVINEYEINVQLRD